MHFHYTCSEEQASTPIEAMKTDLPLSGDWKVCCLQLLIAFSCLQGAISQPGLSQSVRVLKQFQVPEAKQGVAVDADFFYVINDHSITKHRKSDGKQVAAWQDQEGQLQHLNSGVVIEGRLYCAHSNYPESPMASSIEIFETSTLKHIGNHSLGILAGSATWVDYWQDSWWVGFAHYSGKGASEGKDNRWTVVVKFDQAWRQTESWLFPRNLLERFAPSSNSGGSWGPDSLLYCSGHDKAELYLLRLPRKGFTLQHVGTIPVTFPGQGFALDRTKQQTQLYGINRKENQVIVSQIK